MNTRSAQMYIPARGVQVLDNSQQMKEAGRIGEKVVGTAGEIYTDWKERKEANALRDKLLGTAMEAEDQKTPDEIAIDQREAQGMQKVEAAASQVQQEAETERSIVRRNQKKWEIVNNPQMQKDLLRLKKIDPNMASGVVDLLSMEDELVNAQLKAQSEQGARVWASAFAAYQAGKPELARRVLADQIQSMPKSADTSTLQQAYDANPDEAMGIAYSMGTKAGTVLKIANTEMALMNVGEGTAVFDPNTGKAVYKNPKPEMTPAERRTLAIQNEKLEMDKREEQREIEKAEKEEQALAKQAEQKRKSLVRNIDRVVGQIDKAVGLVRFGTTSRSGAVAREVNPRSDAATLQNTIDTIVANIGFDKLQQMREMSPTGGALGQVSDRELNALQAVLANLTTMQGEDTLKANLGLAKEHYANWKMTLNGELPEKYKDEFSENSISDMSNDDLLRALGQ